MENGASHLQAAQAEATRKCIFFRRFRNIIFQLLCHSASEMRMRRSETLLRPRMRPVQAQMTPAQPQFALIQPPWTPRRGVKRVTTA
jgi:hypothetical protein